MTAVRALAMVLVVVLFGGAAWYVWDDARAPLAPGPRGAVLSGIPGGRLP